MRFRPSSTRNKPAEKGTKERKLNIRTVAGRAWVVINFATEGMDFVQAVWGAIPKRLQSKPKWFNGKKHPVSFKRKLQDIYDHFEHIDLAHASWLFLNNQAEDFVFGQIGRRTGIATRNMGVTTGLNRAVRQTSKQAGEVTGESLELPSIVYDPATGTVSWDWGTVGGG